MVSDPILARLDHWQRQLIDLTKRNRLLNYKPTRVTTIRIVDELPTEVFRRLFIERRPMTFNELPEEPEQAKLPLDSPATGSTPRKIKVETSEFGQRERSSLALHHTDDRLQTNLSQDKLEVNLLRIFQTATGLLEDQGVNSLFLTLGMVRWFESDDSNAALDAPLILLPVQLERQTARSTFSLRATGDDPLLNPALVEKLRLDFRLTLPPLPDVLEDFDPDAFFLATQEALARRQRWKVTNAIELGLFTFQKFVMYQAIAAHSARLAAHPAIQALCTGRGERVRQLPPDIKEASLDKVFTPESTAQVLDADSSQQRALLAVSKGYDLALEGPPGTGKSQTIANLIAGALAAGQRVLFVSEKMAALRVVHGRLAALGLQDFCLELHSNKANKRAVLEELARVLDGPRIPDHVEDGQLQRLADVREDLNGYDAELHEPLGRLGKSPYEVLGLFAKVSAAPTLNVALPAGRDAIECDLASFEQICRDLREHAALLAEIGDPGLHPWRGSTRRVIGDLERDRLEEGLGRATTGLAWLLHEAQVFAESIGAVPPTTFGQIEVLCAAALSLASSPRTSETILRNERWNTLSAEVSNLLERGRRFAASRHNVLKTFSPSILEEGFEPLHTQFKAVAGSWSRVFRPAYWRTRKALRAYFAADYQPADNATLLDALDQVAACRADMLAIKASSAAGLELFGERWRGPESDWHELQHFATWIVGVRQLLVAEALESKGLTLAAQGGLDAAAVQERVGVLRRAHEAIRREVEQIAQLAAFTPQSGVVITAGSNIGALHQRVAELHRERGRLRSWLYYQDSLQRCREGLAGPFLERFMAEHLQANALEPAFRRLFYRHWLDRAAAARPRFAHFQSLRHEQKIAEFKQLDQHALTLARQRTLHRLSQKRDRLLADPQVATETTLVQRQYRMRARHLPLRQLLKRAPTAIRAIKPCFMMSPLSVAQYLDPELHQFDIVVFDEASQIAPPDAIGAILQGKQIVVVGDTKQLPPTNFFSAQITSADDLEPGDGDGDGIVDDVESILDDFVASGFPRERLKWHYRSRHESLIAFSNRNFYDGELLTFPGPETSTQERGLRFEWVGGVYEGKGVNPIEARVVADAVCEHARTQPHLSLIVGTFNVRQQTLIWDELERRRKADPTLEPFFARRDEEKFDVKNLENIQGDERDVVFLSITYGPDAEGRVRYNFGPINGENGRRRLNVIATRARFALRVFSSLRAEQIDLTRARSDGAQRLRDYLLFAERGTLATLTVNPEAEMDSPFEEAVYGELTQRGLRLVPQVGQAGYRIDFGVLDDAVPGRFIAGIECDGATYHSAATARDRDRLRQQVLEGLGWRIHRIWSTDWYRDREAQIERILRFVAESRDVAEREARARESLIEIPTTSGLPRTMTEPEAAAREVPVTLETPTDMLMAEDGPAAEARRGVQAALPSEPVAPYTFTPIRTLGTPEQFHLEPDDRIANVLLNVVFHEAPIHLAEATRRVAQHWQASRAGNRIRDRVNNVARMLHRRGALVLREDFLWRTNQQDAAVRSRAVDGYVFAAEHISPAEYQAAVIRVLESGRSMLREELIVQGARVFGYERAGHRLAERLTAAIQSLVEEGTIRPGASGLQLANAGAVSATGSNGSM
jgi:very-short-patch-repair endonuclease